jgi:hypothetical protein
MIAEMIHTLCPPLLTQRLRKGSVRYYEMPLPTIQLPCHFSSLPPAIDPYGCII